MGAPQEISTVAKPVSDKRHLTIFFFILTSTYLFAVFQENEDVYYLTESAFAFSSSAMIPIGTAGKAGELTFRSGTVMLGKEGVSTLAGYVASNLVYDKTNNQTLGMIAGILASTGSAKGLNMADAKLGWSNKGVKGNVVESVTGNIETRVVVRLMY